MRSSACSSIIRGTSAVISLYIIDAAVKAAEYGLFISWFPIFLGIVNFNCQLSSAKVQNIFETNEDFEKKDKKIVMTGQILRDFA
jgi:hypothetical protein